MLHRMFIDVGNLLDPAPKFGDRPDKSHISSGPSHSTGYFQQHRQGNIMTNRHRTGLGLRIGNSADTEEVFWQLQHPEFLPGYDPEEKIGCWSILFIGGLRLPADIARCYGARCSRKDSGSDRVITWLGSGDDSMNAFDCNWLRSTESQSIVPAFTVIPISERSFKRTI
ncbi:hypothetical protein K440DRAFT_644031 [Wilcoxina mikolae CBS 423.85]|nr:hypothetical protein K440DRAFT_644031 [Wilcoxina mikolae CBS 423.85]